MSRRLPILMLAAAAALLVSSSLCRAKIAPPRTYQEMDAIVRSDELTKQEKIEKLKEYFEKEPYWPAVLYRIAQVNKAAARAITLELFRKEDTSRERKLQLGRLLLQRHKAPDFIDEYGPFLIDAVLNGGQKEFCAKRESHKITAVGEYAFIASGFEGHSPEHFKKIKDRRVIPVLIRCLDAPDTVYGKQQGCIRMGKPGESTGRNVQRQQIPIALAKLGATQALGSLRKHLMTHHDYWLRYHSAYALAVLMNRRDSRKVEEKLKGSKDLSQFLFPFGTGLIEKGDDDGVQYMAFKYSVYAKRDTISAVLYMLEQRLQILEGFRSKKTEEFYRQALEYRPLYNVFVFDARKVAFAKYLTKRVANGRWEKITTGAEALALAESRIIQTYNDIIAEIKANDLKLLAPVVSRIAGRTRSPEIKEISEKYLAELGK